MQKLPADVIRDCLANAVARNMKQGWEVIATGPTDVYMGRSKPKHNGVLGGGILGALSIPVGLAWFAMRQFDRKAEGLHIHISEYTAVIDENKVDYEQMMAQLSLQMGNNVD